MEHEGQGQGDAEHETGGAPARPTTSIEWRKEFETGFPEVDRDHAHLIDVINGLVQRLGETPPKALVRNVLEEIYVEITAHFALEEKIMREHGYDQYDDHKADHEFLLDEIRAIMNSVGEGPDFVLGELLVRRLSRWFTEHFKTRDMRLHKMLE
jgi:hemerythrin